MMRALGGNGQTLSVTSELKQIKTTLSGPNKINYIFRVVEERANFAGAEAACQSESIPYSESTLLRPDKIGEVYAKMKEEDIYEGKFRVNLHYSAVVEGWVDGKSNILVINQKHV